MSKTTQCRSTRLKHLLKNIAISGDWGGQTGTDDTIFPRRLPGDYVPVYGHGPDAAK